MIWPLPFLREREGKTERERERERDRARGREREREIDGGLSNSSSSALEGGWPLPFHLGEDVGTRLPQSERNEEREREREREREQERERVRGLSTPLAHLLRICMCLVLYLFDIRTA